MNLTQLEKDALLVAVYGAEYEDLDAFAERVEKEGDDGARAVLTVLEFWADSSGNKPAPNVFDQAVNYLRGAPVKPDLAQFSAEQLRKLIEAQNLDVFAGVTADRQFGHVLEQVVTKTYQNAFAGLMIQSAKEAVREASLDVLRKAYISIAAGSTESDLVKAIRGIKPGGGSDDGAGGRADMP